MAQDDRVAVYLERNKCFQSLPNMYIRLQCILIMSAREFASGYTRPSYLSEMRASGSPALKIIAISTRFPLTPSLAGY